MIAPMGPIRALRGLEIKKKYVFIGLYKFFHIINIKVLIKIEKIYIELYKIIVFR